MNEEELAPFAQTAIKVGPESAFSVIDSRFVQYEWVEEEKKWIKFFASDPEPPEDLPPGKFDGQIVDVEK